MLTILIDFSNFSGVKVYFKLKKKVITKGFYCHAKPFYKTNYEAIFLITKFFGFLHIIITKSNKIITALNNT